jgi:hypothetical protein
MPPIVNCEELASSEVDLSPNYTSPLRWVHCGAEFTLCMGTFKPVFHHADVGGNSSRPSIPPSHIKETPET